MALCRFKISWIVRWRDFHNTSSKFHIYHFIGNNWNFFVYNRQNHFFSDKFFVAFIFWMNRHSLIRQKRFWTCRRNLELFIRSRNKIINVIHFFCHFLVFYLDIRNHGFKSRRIVHHIFSTIDQIFFEKVNKNTLYELVCLFIKSKSLLAPINGRTHFFHLILNISRIFLNPFPAFFQKFFATKLFTVASLRTKAFFYLGLCRNPRMIRSWNPKR